APDDAGGDAGDAGDALDPCAIEPVPGAAGRTCCQVPPTIAFCSDFDGTNLTDSTMKWLPWTQINVGNADAKLDRATGYSSTPNKVSSARFHARTDTSASEVFTLWSKVGTAA